MKKWTVVLAAGGCVALLFWMGEQGGGITYEITGQTLSDALNSWARASGYTVSTPTNSATGDIAPSLEGRFTPDEALRLLLKNSPTLSYCFLKPTHVVVAPKDMVSSHPGCKPAA